MENSYDAKDNNYYPDDNIDQKINAYKEQTSQVSNKQEEEEEEEDEKESNNQYNNENSKEEEKINNFSFGKKNKKIFPSSNLIEDTNLYMPYVKNNINSTDINYNYKGDEEYGENEEDYEQNEEGGEIEDEEEYDNYKKEDSIQEKYEEDSDKDSNGKFPYIINLFKKKKKDKNDVVNQRRIMEITEAFNLFDKDCDGNIDIKELATVMRTLGYDPNQEELDDIIKTFDVDKSGTIDKEEFISLLTTKLKEQKDDKDLLEIFNMFDKDRDGLISEKDVNYIIDEIGEEFDKDIIKELFSMGDDDKDGNLNFIEFKKIFNSKIEN